MSSRRPHWDKALFDAVKETLPSYYEDDSDLYYLIAAVEDWCWQKHTMPLKESNNDSN